MSHVSSAGIGLGAFAPRSGRASGSIADSGKTTSKHPEGKLIHAAIKIGDSTVMLVDEVPTWGAYGPKSLKGTSVTMHLSVADADASAARAIAAGATLIMPVADAFWGDRYGVLEDPFGHRWSVATHMRDMTPEEILQAMPK